MKMDEDEECLPETSSLNTYLQDLGFSDVQVTKTEGGNLANKFRASVAKFHPPVKVIDKDVLDQIEIITSTKLLFEEDFLLVETVLSNFKVLNNEIPKIIYRDCSLGIVIFLALCFYLVIGYYALVIISPFYAYKCTNYFNRKQFDKVEIKNLVKVLYNNSNLLKKIVYCIKRNRERFLLLQINHTELSFQEKEAVNFYFYSRFRSDFLLILNEMINILLYSTQQLIKKIPLIDYADIPEYYLCSLIEKNFTFDDPSKLYLLYMLVQSEFLRRIILSLIPNMHAIPKGNFNKLEKLFRVTTVKITELNKILGHKFEFAFRQGIQEQFELTKTKGSPVNDDYTGEFISSIHDITNAFTKLLLNCRFIEESLKSNKLPQNIETNLISLKTAIKDCERNVENSFILLKKANAVSNIVNEEMEQKEETAIMKNEEKCSLEEDSVELQNMMKEGVNLQEEEISTSDDNLNKIKIGDTDLACTIEDDVFEAYISKENQNADSNLEDWDLDEILKDNLKKEFSQSVMKELKGRLVEKAKNWKKREMNVLRKKGLIGNNNEELLKNELNEVENDIQTKAKNTETYYEEISFEKKKQYHPEITKLFSEASCKGQFDLDDQMETQHCFGNLCKGFLKDLSETRRLILISPIAEEEFCLSMTDEKLFDDKYTE